MLFEKLRMEWLKDWQRQQMSENGQALAVYPEIWLIKKQTGPFLDGSLEKSTLGLADTEVFCSPAAELFVIFKKC